MSDDSVLDNIKSRLEKYLERGEGKFCMEGAAWKVGYVTLTMFKKFLQSEVKAGRLLGETDELGRVWYSRPL